MDALDAGADAGVVADDVDELLELPQPPTPAELIVHVDRDGGAHVGLPDPIASAATAPCHSIGAYYDTASPGGPYNFLLLACSREISGFTLRRLGTKCTAGYGSPLLECGAMWRYESAALRALW